MSIVSLTAIPIGYMLGAIPTSLVIAKLFGKMDLRIEGDGRISAAAIYWRFGIYPYLLVLLIDIGKAALAVFLASLLGEPFTTLLITGFFAVIGHCWSVFLRFRGGLGATVICGVLFYLFPIPLLIGFAAVSIFFIYTRKSGLSSAIIITITSIVLLIQGQSVLIVLYPFILICLMLIKRLQTRRFAPAQNIQAN
jgi:acyl phosphate:glycerol-3-phosphate acyltransferase